jgi:hypothetical protein
MEFPTGTGGKALILPGGLLAIIALFVIGESCIAFCQKPRCSIMPRSKQGASWVRKAESVDGENELHVGDTVKTFSLRGNPRKTSTPVNSLYLVASPSTLGPMYIAGFASVAAITTEEFKTLKTALGARLSKTVR